MLRWMQAMQFTYLNHVHLKYLKYLTRSVQNLNSMPNKCLSNYFAFKSLYCLHCHDCGLDISETLDHTTRCLPLFCDLLNGFDAVRCDVPTKSLVNIHFLTMWQDRLLNILQIRLMASSLEGLTPEVTIVCSPRFSAAPSCVYLMWFYCAFTP